MPNPSLPPRVPQRKTGEQFNPWRGVCGFYPPDIVARQRDLGSGPKRLYERLVRWAGHKGTCWYSFDTMAAALGKCVRQVKSDIATLEAYGLIAHQRRGRRLANLYTFLWHPLFDGGEVQFSAPPDPCLQEGGDVQPNAHHRAGKEVQLPPSDMQPAAPGDGQSAAHELCNRNSVQGIASSSAQSQPGEPFAAELMDDDLLSMKTPENTVHECLMAFVRALCIATPVGRMPVNEIAEELATIGATVRDLVGFLKDYAARWRDAPASWNHVLVSFRHWAKDPKTHAGIRRRLARDVAAEAQRQAGVETELTVGTEDGCSSAPDPVPNVQTVVRRLCSDCRDAGVLGNAIDQTLRFCDCSAGGEVRHRDGENWP